MIFADIDRKIEGMKEVRRQELIKLNQAQQNLTDKKYHKLVNQVNDLSQALVYAQKNLNFSVSDILRSKLVVLLTNLKTVVDAGYADKEAVTKAEEDFKEIQSAVKTEWGKYYSSYTSTRTSTLRVIIGIDAEKINRCISNIKSAETWSTNVSVLAALKSALEMADDLIKGLNMDQGTVSFLTKMASGKATIADLDDAVLMWIRKEQLERKIKISFSLR